MKQNDDTGVEPELARGLIYIHEKLGTRILQHTKLEAHVYALTEALIAKGIVSLREIEQRRGAAEEQMVDDALTHWEGAQVLSNETDKYTVEPVSINCGERIHLCKAACCRLTFALSKQDLQEGVVRWDVGRPYNIRHGEDGWCTHCEPHTKRCGVHERRPLVCRGYDCRSDERIWEDFDKMIPHPRLGEIE